MITSHGTRVRSIATAVLTALTLLLVTLVAPQSASATSRTPGDFSSAVSPNPAVGQVDDCTVELGVVFDSVAYPNYRHIGGVRINCASVHSVIDATVALYFYNGYQWVQYGNGTYGARYGQYGSGYGIAGILRTPAYCVGGYRANWWIVGATVRTERVGRTLFSNALRDPSGGC